MLLIYCWYIVIILFINVILIYLLLWKTILIDATPTTELSPGPYWTLESLHQLTQHNSVCPDRSLKCCSSASSSHHLQDLRSRPLCAVWWWPFRSQNWPRSQMTGVYTARGIPQEFSDMGLKKKWLVDPERQPYSREWWFSPFPISIQSFYLAATVMVVLKYSLFFFSNN